jgi:hypothetical protein
MPLKLLLESAGPGRGLLHVEGPSEPAESVNLAIQRNDGRFLGQDGHWQPTPYWHPQFSAEPDAGGLRIELGPALMDGIIAMHGAPLMLSLRIDGREDRGVVRVRGSLVGSDAAAPEPSGQPGMQAHGAAGAELPADRTTSLDVDLDEGAGETTAVGGKALQEPKERSGSRWLAVLGAAMLLVLAAGAALWYFDIPQRLLAGKEAEPVPVELETAETEETDPAETEQQSGFATSPESALTGLKFVMEYLAEGPSADAMLAEAESRSEAGDCDAALILYSRAAETEPALGVPVARLYDPPTYAEGGCIDAANEEAALEYYRGAAEVGVAEAMRRTGEILTARAASGAVHEEGAQWLRRAEAVETGGAADETPR